MPRLHRLAVLMSMSLLLTLGCSAASRGSDQSASESAPRTASAPAPAAAPAQARATGGGAAQNQADAAQQTLPSTERMVIYTVGMTIAVQNVQDAFRRVERIATEQHGLIAGSQIRQDGDRTTATLTVRVPADTATYQETLVRLRAVAERVVEEQSQAQDITEEYVDLESRLRNLRASEESLLALLGRAQRVEDILQIQRELTNVRGQIEQIQGRKQALERRADMATITLTIREVGAFSRPGWNPGDTVGEAVRALGGAARALATLGIWLLIFSPIWGGLLLALWLLWRFVTRGRRRRHAAPAQ